MRKILLQSVLRPPLTEKPPASDDPELIALMRELKQGMDAVFGGSLAIRQIDAGSCNGCELEINALSNPFYDLERFGLKFVASPRHADVLLVTGPVTANMREALRRTYDATPSPKWVIAAGACALDGGLYRGSYACVGGVAEVIPVDLHIPGCPPEPKSLIRGLLALATGPPRAEKGVKLGSRGLGHRRRSAGPRGRPPTGRDGARGSRAGSRKDHRLADFVAQ